METKERELKIFSLQAELEKNRNKLVELCRERGSQYATLSNTYEDNSFCVIDGWRANDEYIENEEVPGEIVSYVDMKTGRVVYVNPDARWDKNCQEIIGETVTRIKNEIKTTLYVATNIEWETDDCEPDLPKNVIIPQEVEEDDITEYLSETYEFLVREYQLIKADREV